MKKNVFIDANIFLSFYHLTEKELTKLSNILNLIEDKQLMLYLPEQVIDETWRNREAKIQEKLKQAEDIKFPSSFHTFGNHYIGYNLYQKNVADCRTNYKNVLEEIKKDIASSKVPLDIVIEEIFQKAKVISRTDEIIAKAQKRVAIGNPPGKNNSLGDAINWESLLEAIPEGENVCIISKDKDFSNPLDAKLLNNYLKEEWKKEKKTPIFFYNNISDFFNEYFSDVEAEIEREKNELIELLYNSGSFSDTHKLIKSLSKYNIFSKEQAKRLLEAFLANHQIYWTVAYSNIIKFYKKLYLSYPSLVEKMLTNPPNLLQVGWSKSQSLYDRRSYYKTLLEEIYANLGKVVA